MGLSRYRCRAVRCIYHNPTEIPSDHVRAMRSSHSSLCNRMPVSLETLGGDILLDLVARLSRVDLLNFVLAVRPSSLRMLFFPLQLSVGFA